MSHGPVYESWGIEHGPRTRTASEAGHASMVPHGLFMQFRACIGSQLQRPTTQS